MSNQQTNNESHLPSNNNDQKSHFDDARKMIESWPEWKRNIRCMPNSVNCSQSNKSAGNK